MKIALIKSLLGGENSSTIEEKQREKIEQESSN